MFSDLVHTIQFSSSQYICRSYSLSEIKSKFGFSYLAKAWSFFDFIPWVMVFIKPCLAPDSKAQKKKIF